VPAVAGRGLGWKKDKPKAPGETPDRLARHKLAAVMPPPAASNQPDILSVIDQKAMGSCVVQSATQNYRANLAHRGIVSPLGSRLFLYYLARAYDHDTANDDGTFLRNAFQALTKFGLPPEDAWPYDDDTRPGAPFSRLPPISAFRAAYDQSAQMATPRYFRIDTEGEERVLDVKRAIAAGHCVSWGTSVSNDFCNDDLGTAPLVPPIGKSIAGGHALLIAGYSGDVFDVVNSWSDSWGSKGWCRMDASYLTWQESSDFWIVDTAPEFSPEVA
jgi:hypothetical protein